MSINVRSNEPVSKTPPAPAAEAKPQASGEATTSAPETNVSEQNVSEESEPSETGAEQGEQNEPETGSEQETEPKDEGKEKPKKKSGFQRRIDKLNQAKAEAQREAEFWRQQALKGAIDSKTEGKVEGKPAAAADGKPNPDSFETHAEYIEALTDWKTDQKLKKRDQEQEQSKLQSEQQKLVNSYAEKSKSFSEKVKDFDEVLAEVDDVPLSPAVRDIILSSENGPELAYELAKNREEYERVCNLSPLAAAREMGKLEARIAAKASAGKQETKKITNAPKPLEPVNAGGKGSVPKSIFDSNLSQAEYERLRKEQIKKRRQA